VDPKVSGLLNEGTDTASQAFLMHTLSSLHAMRYDAGDQAMHLWRKPEVALSEPCFTRQ